MAQATFSSGSHRIEIEAELNDADGEIRVTVDGELVYAGQRQDFSREIEGGSVTVRASGDVVVVDLGSGKVVLRDDGEFETSGSLVKD